MSECEEIAQTLKPIMPKGLSFEQAEVFVRKHMPGETEQVIDNVAWALAY